jgi:hypothetical protein
MIEGISEAASENTQKPERDEAITSLITMIHGGEAVNHEKGEVASDISVKRKRGRPPLFEYGSILWGESSNATTRRGQLEALYAREASWVLFKHRHQHPELIELTGLHKHDDGQEFRDINLKRNLTILAELGRLIVRYTNGEEVAVKWAVEILNQQPKPTIKQAVQILRRARLTQEAPKPDAEKLACKILEAVESYADSHPAINNSQIIEALESALGWYDSYEDDENQVESQVRTIER